MDQQREKIRKQQERYLLEYVNAEVWGRELQPENISYSPDWSTIRETARKQAVMGLTANGILTQQDSSRLPSDAAEIKKLLELLHFSATRTALHRSVLAELVTYLERHGIHPILLKGLGVAALYPNPRYRDCGDIDLYVGEESYERSLQLLLQLTPESKVSVVKDDKHYALRYRDVEIELHRITESLSVPAYNRRFQQWTKEWLTRRPEAEEHLNIDGVRVSLPPVQYNVVYLFNHIWHHFCIYGIGLHQFYDLALYLHHHYDEIDRMQLKKDLERFGLMKPWKMFGSILVDHIHMEKDKYPFYTTRYAKEGDLILDMIFEDGNFGKYSPWLSHRPQGYIQRKTRSCYYWWRRLFRVARFSPLYATFTCLDYMAFGVKVVFNDLTGRK